ncbi:MAG: aldehyde ferredoxin oxidoreductase family protein [Dehalococcoidales bacterium]|nr:aldehyde ferredoxin oxidoreductase family protein [Dehalococcoidales bacterium]
MAGGYAGKTLIVNLSTDELVDEVFDDDFSRKYIGGYGIGARLLLDRQPGGIDPLGPDSIFGIVSGVLTGTPCFAGSRYSVLGKSPLTGGWGDANSGGYFGPHMKFAGYDAVYVKGISEKPVYIYLDNGRAELRDASHLWGKDTYETEDILKDEHGKDVRIASIGPSAEKLSLITGIIHDKTRAAGRSGMGAVMGSKKLKAVVVKGNIKIPLHDEEKANELRRKYLKELGPGAQFLRDLGTSGNAHMSARSGDTPVKNWGGVGLIDFPNADELSGEHVRERLLDKYGCYHCPIAGGGHMKAGTGEYKYAEGAPKPEYETLGMFGANLLNSNLDSIIMANDICNRYSLDTISAGATIGFTIECYENGLLTKADTDGIEMTWGNHRAIIAMLEKLAKREGFGDIIADGTKVAAERIGKGSEAFAMHIQGQELPAHDPKYGIHWVTTYQLDPTPGRHTQGSETMNAPGLVPVFEGSTISGRAVAHKRGSNFNHIVNCTGMCAMVYGSFAHVDAVAEFLNAVTGWDTTTEELLLTGERISNLRQVFNLREGLYSPQFKVPGRIFGHPPQEEGPLAGKVAPAEIVQTEYLNEMDWDLEKARPSKKKLAELGLEDLTDIVWP